MSWCTKSLSSPIITLTTDFGLGDGYVAALKGVILGLRPEASIVDLCHLVPAQDLARAAYLLRDTCPSFPAGTIHLVVVDPEVGSTRRLILLDSAGQRFLAPDNGVLTLVTGEGAAAWQVACPHLYRQPPSATFHGRDILAPLAAHLANGLAPAHIGPALPTAALHRLPLPLPILDLKSGRLRGEVIHIDHFGNLATNIHAADIRQLTDNPAAIEVRLGAAPPIRGILLTYAQAQPGQALAVIGGNGHLEIAVNQGHAARALGLGLCAPVLLSIC